MILVGHSTGGLSVIHAMHHSIDRIKQAFFVAATMLPFGLQTDEDKKDVMSRSFSLFSHRMARILEQHRINNIFTRHEMESTKNIESNLQQLNELNLT